MCGQAPCSGDPAICAERKIGGFGVDGVFRIGAPDRIRTCDLCLRRAALFVSSSFLTLQKARKPHLFLALPFLWWHLICLLVITGRLLARIGREGGMRAKITTR